jgi:redox-sensitive bicupin YhaK (pirin superfamily)
MINLRRSNQRAVERIDGSDVWSTFASNASSTPCEAGDAWANGFGVLESLRDVVLRPGGRWSHAPREGEVVTYVRHGNVTFDDSTGASGVIAAGEFRRVTSRRGVRYGESNASSVDTAQVFQLCFAPQGAGLEPGWEQRRFWAANRRRWPCLVAAPDGRRGSLLLHQDALVYSALLTRGRHVVHELLTGRRAWVHLVDGAVVLDDVVLSTGDGAGVDGEGAVSLTAREESEILLVDLGHDPARRNARLETNGTRTPGAASGEPSGAPPRAAASSRFTAVTPQPDLAVPRPWSPCDAVRSDGSAGAVQNSNRLPCRPHHLE